MKLHLNKQKQLGSVAANDYCLLIALIVAIFAALLASDETVGSFNANLTDDITGILAGVDDMDGSDVS